jgi:hypothetical protein
MVDTITLQNSITMAETISWQDPIDYGW